MDASDSVWQKQLCESAAIAVFSHELAGLYVLVCCLLSRVSFRESEISFVSAPRVLSRNLHDRSPTGPQPHKHWQ